MKKLIIIAFFTAFSGVLLAQKYAYVDSKYILNKIPEYTDAQSELNKLSTQWQNEIDDKFAEVKKLQEAFDADEFLLPEDMKQKRLAEIDTKYKAAMALQKQYFGVSGELFTKRQELIKPLQDKIFKAIKQIAEQGSYVFIFDKGTQSNILYANPRYDKSDAVLKKMGY